MISVLDILDSLHPGWFALLTPAGCGALPGPAEAHPRVSFPRVRRPSHVFTARPVTLPALRAPAACAVPPPYRVAS
ncbi:hypothetical protein [Actinoplanes xinjiangensis]|uniref:hypothetical protein n=1 Tax=Actinoplanes xinjiangensis TaxID=512350 RepID=UPI00344A2FCD